MSDNEKIEELERKNKKIIACISTSDTYNEFKECMERRVSHYEVHKKIAEAAKRR